MSRHVPVLTAEVLQYLRPERGGLYVDCTVGLGGHSRALLEAGASRIIGFDRDADALAIARETLAPWGDRVELIHADYRSVASWTGPDARAAEVRDKAFPQLLAPLDDLPPATLITGIQIAGSKPAFLQLAT